MAMCGASSQIASRESDFGVVMISIAEVVMNRLNSLVYL